MELVEYHKPDIRQLRIVQKALSEKPFRDNFKACARRHLPFKTDGIPHSAADILTKLRCDVRRRATRGKTPRFEHENLLSRKPRLIKKRWRNTGGLAAAGRCAKHHITVRSQRCGDSRNHLFYGKNFL